MTHLPRLHLDLRELLHGQRVAALGSLNVDGTPMVSMVPYAIDTRAPCLVIHVSSLAAHTGNLLRSPAVSMLIMRAEVAGEPVHALARATLQGQAQAPTPESPLWHQAREAYLARFPEAAAMMDLGDFRLVRVLITQMRQIAGFGAARSIDHQEIAQLLAPPPPA
ncbi:MAG: pyridoxamine 5'-phosphate oxidase family protein [Rhodoferax sp.]|nr:pyridoxamine 5'-phosphate oxidase family protein [Rhodoferax sp.]MBP9930770.1 pyridoxamine 5'-phosphate oxidase family protein [Rhodoferax sp.]HQX61505.1 pyridoxamine 5'-phosphate oxidase family protein [Burkholderiaceae bacterium]HQZ04397.1 pyridoxamine 5'-phosphate oxidase family protein [Burkholderiaceae bacterium]HRA64059.1 pyridoxamine 5'-phosphate oxidase family protein [Burkholderiaceae bacterium]